MRDFWKSCDYSLVRLGSDGFLYVTDDFFRSYLERPELKPVSESCKNELSLHANLKSDPQQPVSNEQIAGLADSEGRENYQILINFRDRLIRTNTLERCYLDIFNETTVTIPPLFLDQMAQIILRQILDGCEDPLQIRAAELFFREQQVTIAEGSILLCDNKTTKVISETAGMGNLGQLLIKSGAGPKKINLDVLLPETASIYWERDEKFDTALDISFPRAGLDALCRVMEQWIEHMQGVEVSIQPVQKINDDHWSWHIGLDSEATGLLNDLYEGNSIADGRMSNLLSLFRLDFVNPSLMRASIAGRPVYLGLCKQSDGFLRFKPQNLLTNLPLAAGS